MIAIVQRTAYGVQRIAYSFLRSVQYAVRSAKKGFSLLEVMLAILLLSTGLVALIQVVNTGLFIGGQNEYTVIAANLAQEKIEELRNTTYTELASETPAVAVTDFPEFTREVLVGDSTPAQTGLKEISVNVNWYAKSSLMTTSMVTYVSDI
jgi:prepilin-type N-terminal cleavage/methylation domain-containing protein